jgi:hypothetical protein
LIVTISNTQPSRPRQGGKNTHGAYSPQIPIRRDLGRHGQKLRSVPHRTLAVTR